MSRRADEHTGAPPYSPFLLRCLQKRVAILQRVAESLLAAQDEILAANEEDVAASSGRIDNTLMQRLKLKPAKLQALAAGAHSSFQGVDRHWIVCLVISTSVTP